MKVYIFGNQDLREDNLAFKVAQRLSKQIKGLEFVEVKPNEDLPFISEKKVIILDIVQGINQVEIIKEEKINQLFLPPRTSVHDFDLSFQLKYLKKLGKLGELIIIGLPQEGRIDYFLIQSIFKKLVAQDMQGS